MNLRKEIIRGNLEDYFSETIDNIYQNQNFESSPLTKDYLVGILVNYVDKENFIDSKRGNRFLFEETNAEMLFECSTSPKKKNS